jgi:hypothetical protein
MSSAGRLVTKYPSLTSTEKMIEKRDSLPESQSNNRTSIKLPIYELFSEVYNFKIPSPV